MIIVIIYRSNREMARRHRPAKPKPDAKRKSFGPRLPSQTGAALQQTAHEIEEQGGRNVHLIDAQKHQHLRAALAHQMGEQSNQPRTLRTPTAIV